MIVAVMTTMLGRLTMGTVFLALAAIAACTYTLVAEAAIPRWTETKAETRIERGGYRVRIPAEIHRWDMDTAKRDERKRRCSARKARRRF